MIKVISFDMDGTLTDIKFDRLLWDEELPRIYSEEKNISLERAKEIVYGEWDKLKGKIGVNWIIFSWWLNHFNLKTSVESVIEKLGSEIKHYPETVQVLEDLKKEGYKLIVVSSAERRLIDAKLKVENVKKYFDKIYSASSDFNRLSKDKIVFEHVLKDLNVKPEEVVHVGDNFKSDFLAPQEASIKTILIDRSGKNKDAMKSLEELKEKLSLL